MENHRINTDSYIEDYNNINNEYKYKWQKSDEQIIRDLKDKLIQSENIYNSFET